MRSLVGSLSDGVLADAILFHPHTPIPSTNVGVVRGRQKSPETSNTNTVY